MPACAGCRYVRLDGSTARVKRMIDINRFNAPNSDLLIYILNTKAGGLGVNLQTADTCILYDSDWNPQVCLCWASRPHSLASLCICNSMVCTCRSVIRHLREFL